MQVTLLLLAVVLGNQYALADNEDLAGYQLWKLSGRESSLPNRLMIDGFLDILDHSKKTEHVVVAPRHQRDVGNLFQQEGISYQVVVEDLAKHIEETEMLERARRDLSGIGQICEENNCPKPLTDQYMTFNQMEWYLKEVDSMYEFTNLTSIGKSHEDRDIWLLHIKSNNASAKAIWIEGGLHAREWISQAVAFGMIQNLLDDETARENFEFFVVPMANPDGNVYSKTSNRLWRKNRRKNDQGDCNGVDLNRNFDNHYGEHGASNNPCSEVYKGLHAFSEPETRALRDAMTAVKDRLSMALLLHSYGQDLLYPWGWTHEDAPDKDEMKKLGEIFSNAAAEISGTKYSVVNSAGGLYLATGATDDWAKENLGVKYSYTLELRDDGSRGFVLGSEHIKPSIEEVWAGFRRMIDNLLIKS